MLKHLADLSSRTGGASRFEVSSGQDYPIFIWYRVIEAGEDRGRIEAMLRGLGSPQISEPAQSARATFPLLSVGQRQRHSCLSSTEKRGGNGYDREGGKYNGPVKRIVANVASSRVSAGRHFYGDILGMDIIMDLGRIVTFAGVGSTPPPIVINEERSGVPAADLSIEVDDLEEVHRRAVAAGLAIKHYPEREPWDGRRFHVRDPLGQLVSILAHH